MDGRELAWEDAMARFVDRTGRPGPATWEGGAPPPGKEDLPVHGVSWYEAAAYARFVGKALPTIHHWWAAVGRAAAAHVAQGSNFQSDEPRAGSTFVGMSPFGIFDAAGNVSEWCYNADTPDKRYILGGSFKDPRYHFTDPYRLPPMDRSAGNGIRLARYEKGDTLLPLAMRPVVRPVRDYSREQPVSDATFATYRVLYEYDPLPLEPQIEATDTATEWVRQTVSFFAGYGRERVRAQLFLPRRGQPPYQTVILFPGGNAVIERSSTRTDLSWLEFLMRDGRALMLPVYRGTYERADTLLGRADYGTNPTIAYRDAIVEWGKELRQSVDYIALRPELDSARVAYVGISMGGRLGGIMLAIEPRFRAAVLIVAGLSHLSTRPEVDPLNFLPRVRAPTLMLNGRYDDVFPYEAGQVPFFRFLGTPAEHKRFVLDDNGHWVKRDLLIRETLGWLDKYLGPVAR